NTGVLLLHLIEMRDEMKKIRLDHLKQDQEMLVIKIFNERKKVFRERKKGEKIRAKSAVADMEHIFHLFEPLSKPDNSLSTHEVQGLTFEEITVVSRAANASATPW
ncbi:hypothetical protein Tco_0918255, partial [Tanacetum coccineum]